MLGHVLPCNIWGGKGIRVDLLEDCFFSIFVGFCLFEVIFFTF